MAGIADDVITRLQQLANNRADFEPAWRQVAAVAAPDAPDFNTSGLFGTSNAYGGSMAMASRRSRNIYDSTAVWATERLSSGIEALVAPQSQYWHGLKPNDLIQAKPNDAETEHYEAVRNLQFEVRYDAHSGWQTAFQTSIRRAIAFGNGFMMVEDGYDPKNVVRYRHIPLNEVYIATDQYVEVDTFYRMYSFTNRQVVQKFGNKAPQKIIDAANNPQEADVRVTIVQAIMPRGDIGRGPGILGAPYQSIHVTLEGKDLLGVSGFYEFPVIDFRWLPEKDWGEGPVMRVLADIQSLNVMARTELVATQQAIDPPLLVARTGVMNRPDTNPGRTILGGIDANGREMVKPLILGQRPDFAQSVIQAKRENLKESMYINLFALMVQTPRMSATEALVRANEKGELLGPAGARLQQGLARLIDREQGILTRAGLYEKGSAFYPPPRIRGKKMAVQFSSPLDRLRRAKEAEGTINTLQILAPLAQVDPTIFDHWDQDETTRGLAEINGVPRKFLRTREEVEALRQQRAAQQQQALALQAAQQMASAAADAAPALKTLSEIAQ